MDLLKIKFILDENIPIKLKKTFQEFKLQCYTFQELGWLGIKDNQILANIRNNDYILVTRDKDFTFIWKEQDLRVIYISIEPAILDTIEPRIFDLFQSWKFSINQPFLIIIQNHSIRFWQES